MLEHATTLVQENGWENLTMVEVARCAGVSRQLVYQHFHSLEGLALEIVATFRDHVNEAVLAGIRRHPDDFGAAIRETLSTYFVGLEDERLIFTDLIAGHWAPPTLVPALKGMAQEHRAGLIKIWTRYYQRVTDLSATQARALSSFKHDTLSGLNRLVITGQLGPEEAICFFIDVMQGAIEHFRRKAVDRSSPTRR